MVVVAAVGTAPSENQGEGKAGGSREGGMQHHPWQEPGPHPRAGRLLVGGVGGGGAGGRIRMMMMCQKCEGWGVGVAGGLRDC